MVDLVTYDRTGGVVVLQLNRPEKLNAFSDEMVIALRDALREFDADPEANVAILCGKGRAFSSGADVNQRQLRPREELERFGGPQAPGARAGDLFTQSVNWKPVVTVVHGYVLGLAVGLMLDSDLVVAETGTQMQVTEVSRGLGGARYWATMQFRNAAAFGTEVALTGRYFSAEEAYAHGLVNRLTEPGAAMTTARELAELIDTNPPLSVRSSVRSRRLHLKRVMEDADMQQAALRLYLTDDFAEAAKARAERRDPEPFRGH
ncbi:MAG: enoyl-CoA hydratase/isomerase family protein [Acidimicrobiales bacterium]